MIIKAMLGSAGIAAMFSGLISYLIFKKQGNLQYITAERKEWREKIRNIANELDGASYLQTLHIMTDLKLRINSFGNGNISSDYDKDAHIWEVINELENEKPSKKVLRIRQEQIIQYLTLLLKADWERSKKEVKGDINYIICGASYMFTIIYFAVAVFMCNENRNISNFQLATYVIIFVFLMGVYQIMCMVCMKQDFRFILKGKIDMDSEKFNKYAIIKCYLLLVIELIGLVAMFILTTYVAFEKIELTNLSWITFLLLGILYTFGLAFQVATQGGFIEQQFDYVRAINYCRAHALSEIEKIK